MREFWGEGCFDLDSLVCGGGGEGDAGRVEEIATLRSRGGSVEFVARDGVPDACEVDSYLVSPPGPDFYFDVGEFFESPQDAPGRDGGAAGGDARGHSRPVYGIAGDGGGDAALIFREPAVYEGEVRFLDCAGGKLACQIPMGRVGARDQDDATGVAVDSMDNAGAHLAAELGQGSKAMQQGIGERSGMGAGTGVHHHSGRLVHGDDGIVLIQDVEWNIFRDCFEGRQLAGTDVDALVSAESIRSLRGAAVHQNVGRLNPVLEAGAAVLRKAVVEKLIQAFAGIVRGGVERRTTRVDSWELLS